MYASFSWDLSPTAPHVDEIESMLAQIFHGRQLASLLGDLFIMKLASGNDFDQIAGILDSIQTLFPGELEYVMFEHPSHGRLRPGHRPHWNSGAIHAITT